MRKGKIHHAFVDQGNESDTQVWVYISCDTSMRFVNEVRFTKRWTLVNCKNCLRYKPKDIAEKLDLGRVEIPDGYAGKYREPNHKFEVKGGA